MATHEEKVKTLAKAVVLWQMQGYIATPPITLYVYYVLTTLDGEVSIMFPQKWGRGRILFTVIRYGPFLWIALHFSRDSRNYYAMTPAACKIVLILRQAVRRFIQMACDTSLALCMSAIIQAEGLFLWVIVLLCLATPVTDLVVDLCSLVRYQVEPRSPLDEALGFPCHAAPTGTLAERTLGPLGGNIRRYVGLAATTILLVAAATTLLRRYRGDRGRLIRVIWRDGGACCFILGALRLAFAILVTPGVLALNARSFHPAYLLAAMTCDVLAPILAQRLLLNLRKVDCMSARSYASSLLFQPVVPELLGTTRCLSL